MDRGRGGTLINAEQLQHPGQRQTLIVDGDDTLWENNVHFERATASFIEFLSHATLAPSEVKRLLDVVEHSNLGTRGYGAVAFSENLADLFVRLAERPPSEADLEHVRRLGLEIREHPMEVIAGVEATLETLSSAHRLVLFTKGEKSEQEAKIENSGLAHHFAETVVTPEKDVEHYEGLVRRLQLDPASTWMIGNSPRSDINPALAAGLGAVLVPHSMTWSLELADLPAFHSRFHRVVRFTDLISLFGERNPAGEI